MGKHQYCTVLEITWKTELLTLKWQFLVLIFGGCRQLRSSPCLAFPFPWGKVPALLQPWLQVSAPYLWWLHYFLPMSSTRTWNPNPVSCVPWLKQSNYHEGKSVEEEEKEVWIVKCLCQKLLSQLMKGNFFFPNGVCASAKLEQDDQSSVF